MHSCTETIGTSILVSRTLSYGSMWTSSHQRPSLVWNIVYGQLSLNELSLVSIIVLKALTEFSSQEDIPDCSYLVEL